MEGPTSDRRRHILAGSVAALVAFAPFVRVFAGGESFFFRDLSGQFFPARRFLLDGLRQGEFRFWNPYVHEGVPMPLSPFGYLPDLLQLILPNELGISLILAAHVPLAAFFFTLLARELGFPPTASAGGGLVYAVGGFSLSTVNLYVYAQTLAWAPLFVLAFHRAINRGGRRRIAWAGIALGVMISTTGLEIALQACLVAAVISPPLSLSRLRSAASVTFLGLGLAAVVILPLLGLTTDSERGSGLATSVVLANSIHPLAFLQVLIAGFFGDTSNLTGVWWGVRFFPRGFPYLMSLYLGPAVVALACVGFTVERRLGRRLFVLVLGAVTISLGRYAGWDALVDLSPVLRFLRFPVKAFFTVQFAVALLVSFAVAAVGNGAAVALRRIAALGTVLGGSMIALPLVPGLAPQQTSWFVDGFLPNSVAPGQRELIVRFITGDAAVGGLVALAVSAVCLLTLKGFVVPSRASAIVATLITADLIRAGAGLNPSVTTDFYKLSPEMAAQARLIRDEGARVFTCDPQSASSYWQGRRSRGAHHEAFTMAVFEETLSPDFNLGFGVRTALSIDRTMLVPTRRVLAPELATCADFDQIVPSLRIAGVTRVLSLEPLTNPSLRLLTEVAPARINPARIRIYQLDGGLPRFSLPVALIRDAPNHLDFMVDVRAPAHLEVREPFASGWRATVNGVTQPMGRTADGHREISLQPGRSEVHMSYLPLGLETGLTITLLASLLCLGLLASTSEPRPPPESES